MRKPNKHGGGSNTNLNGLKFEGRTDFITSIINNKNFYVKHVKNFKKTYQMLLSSLNLLIFSTWGFSVVSRENTIGLLN